MSYYTLLVTYFYLLPLIDLQFTISKQHCENIRLICLQTRLGMINHFEFSYSNFYLSLAVSGVMWRVRLIYCWQKVEQIWGFFPEQFVQALTSARSRLQKSHFIILCTGLSKSLLTCLSNSPCLVRSCVTSNVLFAGDGGLTFGTKNCVIIPYFPAPHLSCHTNFVCKVFLKMGLVQCTDCPAEEGQDGLIGENKAIAISIHYIEKRRKIYGLY